LCIKGSPRVEWPKNVNGNNINKVITKIKIISGSYPPHLPGRGGQEGVRPNFRQGEGRRARGGGQGSEARGQELSFAS